MKTYIDKICIGTAQFGSSYGLTNFNNGVSKNEIKKILNFSKDNGISHLDTAPSYGNAEKILGELNINNWNVITKVKSEDNRSNKDQFRTSVLESLSKLKIERLYGVLVHNPRLFYNSNINELLNQLSIMKQEGIIKKIGVSVYDSEEIDFILSNFDIDIIQLPFNIVDGRLLEKNSLEKLKNRNIEVHARSVYLQGLLLMHVYEQVKQFKKWKNIWDKLNMFCNDNNITPLEVCLNYVLQNKNIDKVIIGIDNFNQLKETINSVSNEIIEIPKDLISLDEDLCNPLNWKMYAHLRYS